MNHILRGIQEIEIRRVGEDSFQRLLVRVHLCAYVWQERVRPEKSVTGNDAEAGAAMLSAWMAAPVSSSVHQLQGR